MRWAGVAVLILVALGCFALALSTEDSKGGVIWTALLVTVGVGSLIGAFAVRRNTSR